MNSALVSATARDSSSLSGWIPFFRVMRFTIFDRVERFAIGRRISETIHSPLALRSVCERRKKPLTAIYIVYTELQRTDRYAVWISMWEQNEMQHISAKYTRLKIFIKKSRKIGHLSFRQSRIMMRLRDLWRTCVDHSTNYKYVSTYRMKSTRENLRGDAFVSKSVHLIVTSEK